MDTLVGLYGMFVKDKGKTKERFDIILEPMQAMTQIALISFCPKGSKLSISNNLLSIQTPTWIQGLTRSYNHDRRDDLFFLFNAIIRFNKFYSFMKSKTGEEYKLYELVLRLSKRGIDNLLQTYSSSDQPSLLHTLQMYRTMLERPEIFANDTQGLQAQAQIPTPAPTQPSLAKSSKNKKNEEKANQEEECEVAQNNNNNTDVELGNSNSNSNKDIDDVFIKIRQLYTKHEFSIIYNNLQLLEKRPEHYEAYTQGINASMMPINVLIKKWINDNIVY